MEIRALGTSGGIGAGLRTTALLIDGRLLIDAGSGVGDLALDEIRAVREVLITHAHLDHVAFLGLMADSRIGTGAPPLHVHAPAEALAALREHMLNDRLWPDFTRVPDPDDPVLVLHALPEAGGLELEGYRMAPLPAAHGVPAVGYAVDDGRAALAFSGDTGPCPALWQALQRLPRLDALIVECALPDALAGLGGRIGHYTPAALAADAAQLPPGARLWITHLKPAERERIAAELTAHGLLEAGGELLHCGERRVL